jgi:hypothetical protein
VRIGGEWGGVCGVAFTQAEGDVVCTQLGYSLGAKEVRKMCLKVVCTQLGYSLGAKEVRKMCLKVVCTQLGYSLGAKEVRTQVLEGCLYQCCGSASL